ncbi:MAG: hypothetical protein AVDCRST_MAG14-2274, partial [uncultured Rubrobacteraceae bacterium]
VRVRAVRGGDGPDDSHLDRLLRVHAKVVGFAEPGPEGAPGPEGGRGRL